MKDFSSAAPQNSEPVEHRELKFRLDKEEFSVVIRSDADAVLSWSELAKSAATAQDDMNSPAGQAFVASYFQIVMEDAEYKRFKQHLKVHKTHPDVLTGIMEYIEAAADEQVEDDADGRPLPQSPASSNGREVKEDRMSLLASIAEDGDVVIAPRPNRNQRRQADRRQAQAAG